MKVPNIMDKFFELGDKATGGDPKRKADFDYYMLWLIFLAFFTILLSNLWDFFVTKNFASLGWSFVMCGILWFQYQNLKMMYAGRKMMKEKVPNPESNKVETFEDMMDGFDKEPKNEK